MTITTAHVVGNGPSAVNFRPTEWKTQDSIIIGCNFSSPDVDPDFTVIIDSAPATRPEAIQFPVVATARARTQLSRQPADKRAHVAVVDEVELIKLKEISTTYCMNSGHHAAMYAIRQYPDLRCLHVWGADAVFDDGSMDSTTEQVFRRGRKAKRPKLVDAWVRYWRWIMLEHAGTEFTFHTGGKTMCPFNDLKNFAQRA